MGAFRFERIPAVPKTENTFEFDSSADLAITRKFGWELGSLELRETNRTDEFVTYDVYARENRAEGAEPRPLIKRGELVCQTKDYAWRKQTSRDGSYMLRHPPTRASRDEFHLSNSMLRGD